MIQLIDSTNNLEFNSNALISWASLDFTLTARSGQLATWTRAATRTVTDSLGNTYDVVANQAAWHYIGSVPTLYLGDDDQHGFPYERTKCFAFTGLLEFYHLAGIDANGGMFYIGNNANTGVRFYVQWSGTAYRAVFNNNIDAAVMSTAAVAPTAGQRVQLRFELGAGGAVQLHQSINGAAESSAAASAAPASGLPASWGADGGLPHARLGGLGTGDEGEAAYVRLILLPGAGRTLAQLEATY